MGSQSVTRYPTQAGTRFTYPGGMEGWVDIVDLIAPLLGVEPATFRSRVQRSTNATTKTTGVPLFWTTPYFTSACGDEIIGRLFSSVDNGQCVIRVEYIMMLTDNSELYCDIIGHRKSIVWLTIAPASQTQLHRRISPISADQSHQLAALAATSWSAPPPRTLGARAFAVAGPKAWNQLPAHLRTLETVGPFKTALYALKAYLHSTQWLSQIVWHAAPL